MRRRLKGNFPTNRCSGYGTRNSTLALVSGQSMLLPARHGVMAAGRRVRSHTLTLRRLALFANLKS